VTELTGEELFSRVIRRIETRVAGINGIDCFVYYIHAPIGEGRDRRIENQSGTIKELVSI